MLDVGASDLDATSSIHDLATVELGSLIVQLTMPGDCVYLGIPNTNLIQALVARFGAPSKLSSLIANLDADVKSHDERSNARTHLNNDTQ